MKITWNDNILRNVYAKWNIRIKDYNKWKEKVVKVGEKLIEIAKKGGTVYYSDLMSEFKISRRDIGGIVGAVSEHEYLNKRPLLSAIVIRKDTNRPGDGFWGLPGINTKCGSKRLSNVEKEKCWKEIIKEVYNFWSKY